MTRHHELTPEAHKSIVADLEAGDYLSDAAWRAGVTPQTVYSWINRGKAGEEPFAAFLDAVKRAEANCKHRLGHKVTEGDKGWQGAMTFMERRWWKQYGRKQQVVDSKGDDIVTSLAALIARDDAEQRAKV